MLGIIEFVRSERLELLVSFAAEWSLPLTISMRRPAVSLSLGALIAVAVAWSPAQAAKTDLLQLTNGDVVTGEIKELDRGRLNYKTDFMETVSVEWDWITQLTSTHAFLVTTHEGDQYFGQLVASGQDRVLRVSFLEQFYDLPMDDVVRIRRIKRGFWDRIDFSVSLGFSYTKASAVTQLTADARIAYRDRKHYGELKANTILTDKGGDEEDVKRRYDLHGTYQRTISGDFYGGGTLAGQRNDELGLKLRVLSGVHAGYRFVQTNSSLFATEVGANVNREYSSDGQQKEYNVEAVLSGSFSLFFYETPKTDLKLDASLYPSLTASKRIRVEADASLRQEVIKDFFVELQYYESYDSLPPSGSTSKSDRGLVFKLSWSK